MLFFLITKSSKFDVSINAFCSLTSSTFSSVLDDPEDESSFFSAAISFYTILLLLFLYFMSISARLGLKNVKYLCKKPMRSKQVVKVRISPSQNLGVSMIDTKMFWMYTVPISSMINVPAGKYRQNVAKK